MEEDNIKDIFKQKREDFLKRLSKDDIEYIDRARKKDQEAFHRDLESLKNDWRNIGNDFPIR